MVTYTAEMNGRTHKFTNRKMAQALVARGYTVTVCRDGKKIYKMCPIDKEEKA